MKLQINAEISRQNSVSVRTISNSFCAGTKSIPARFLFTRHKNGDCDAFFLQRRKAALRRSLTWSVTYRIGQCSYLIPDTFRFGTKNYLVIQCELIASYLISTVLLVSQSFIAVQAWVLKSFFRKTIPPICLLDVFIHMVGKNFL